MTAMEISHLFGTMDISTAALTAQRRRMNTIAENIANAETTRTPEGGPYRRKETVLASDQQFSLQLDNTVRENNSLERSDPNHLPGKDSSNARSQFSSVKASVQADPSPFRKVYDPGHPDADADGMVSMPNVDIVQEMTDLISASRAFEANATVFNATKAMMKKALEI
jgi:flagellar basal-body rod protein FlgC